VIHRAATGSSPAMPESSAARLATSAEVTGQVDPPTPFCGFDEKLSDGIRPDLLDRNVDRGEHPDRTRPAVDALADLRDDTGGGAGEDGIRINRVAVA
jgi:hypothetical protein